jgi:superfamily II DNA helicase RecQ
MPRDKMLEKKCLWTLQELLNDKSAEWSSPQQGMAVMSVLERKTDVIAMLKTGGGKSMLPIIAAIMEPEKAVVVILPLRSLMTDWERKLRGMGVPFQVYDPKDNLNNTINLILASADKAKFKTFRTHLAELNETLPVARIVFDEAHLPLTSNDFRDSMQHMSELRQFPMQLVLLSGTIPSTSITALKKTFGLMANAKEIRQPTNRPELEYILKVPAPSRDLEKKAIEIVEKERENWSPKDRGLVFVTYMEDGESLATEVRCHHLLAYAHTN